MKARPGVATEEALVGGVRRRADISSDATLEGDLLESVRAGDDDAYGELYRIHGDAVERLARRLCRDRHEADDVASDVFCNTLRAIRSGSGPRDDCRAYLLRSVRHTLIKRRTRQDTGRAAPCANEDLERPHLDDIPIAGGPATDAFNDVSEHFQELLWYVEVQGYDSADVAIQKGIAKPAAASVMYRARRALRRAYLGGCVHTPIHDDSCTPVRSLLPSFVDGDTSTPGADRVRAHLATCIACNRALDEMNAVHDRIGTRGFLALLPGALRVIVTDGAHVLGSAISGTSTVVVAAATIAVGAVALPASERHHSYIDAASATAPGAPRSTPALTTPMPEPAPLAPPRIVPTVVDPVGADDRSDTGATVSTQPSNSVTTSVPPVGPPIGDVTIVGPDDTGEGPSGTRRPVLDKVVGGAPGQIVGSVVAPIVGTTGAAVTDAVDAVEGTVGRVGGIVDDTATAVVGRGGLAENVVGPVPALGQIDDVIDGATDRVDDLVGTVGGSADGTIDLATGTIDDLLRGRRLGGR